MSSSPVTTPHHTTSNNKSKTKQITIREEEINGGPRRRVNRLWTRVMINVVSDPLLGDCPLKGMGTNPSRTFSDGKAKLASYLLRCTVSCLCMMVVVQSQSEGGYDYYIRMHNTTHQHRRRRECGSGLVFVFVCVYVCIDILSLSLSPLPFLERSVQTSKSNVCIASFACSLSSPCQIICHHYNIIIIIFLISSHLILFTLFGYQKK